MCPVCKNEELELGQKYCQICGEPLEWEEDKQDHFVEANKTIGKDINDPTKWIPVEERLPVQGEPVSTIMTLIGFRKKRRNIIQKATVCIRRNI